MSSWIREESKRWGEEQYCRRRHLLQDGFFMGDLRIPDDVTPFYVVLKENERYPKILSFLFEQGRFPHHHPCRMVYCCQWEKKRINLKTQAPVLQRNISHFALLIIIFSNSKFLILWETAGGGKYWHFAALLRPSLLTPDQLLEVAHSAGRYLKQLNKKHHGWWNQRII